jgi:hypothetical protein
LFARALSALHHSRRQGDELGTAPLPILVLISNCCFLCSTAEIDASVSNLSPQFDELTDDFWHLHPSTPRHGRCISTSWSSTSTVVASQADLKATMNGPLDGCAAKAVSKRRGGLAGACALLEAWKVTGGTVRLQIIGRFRIGAEKPEGWNKRNRVRPLKFHSHNRHKCSGDHQR